MCFCGGFGVYLDFVIQFFQQSKNETIIYKG